MKEIYGMFQNLMNKLNQFLNPQDEVTLQLLGTIAAPLAEIEQTLPEKVVEFIISGSHPDVLLTLDQQPNDKAAALLGSPGTYNWYWSSTQITKPQEKLRKASEKARYKLYSYLLTHLNSEQIIRYGKFLASATQQKNYIQLSKDTAPWFHYVLIDGLVTSLKNMSFDDKQRSSHIQSWSLDALFQLYLADDQHTAQGFITQLFERESTRYYSDHLESLWELKDSYRFLHIHQQYIKEVVPTLSANAQQLFLNTIKAKSDLLKEFSELVVALSISASKSVRELATQLLSQLDQEQTQQHLKHFLIHGSTKQRSYVPDLLARLGLGNRQILQDALEQETQKAVQASIQTALNRLESLEQVQNAPYDIPPLVELEFEDIPESFLEVLRENHQALLLKAKQAAEDEIEENKTASYKSKWSQDRYKDLNKISPDFFDQKLLDEINGKQPFKNFPLDNIIFYQNKILNYPEYGLKHALHLRLRHSNWMNWRELFTVYMKPHHFQDIELRQLISVMESVHYKSAKRLVAEGYLFSGYYDNLHSFISDKEKILPFFMENSNFLAEALGLLPSESTNQYYRLEPSHAIQILKLFPHLPKEFIPRLLEIALGENKRLRFEAQELLQIVPNVHERAIEALQNSKQEIRITAIDWLSRLGHESAVNELYALLKKEKKEIVVAAILTALEQLGEDISRYLSSDALLKEAEKGLKGKLSSSITWFDFDRLPTVYWQDGQVVDAKIIQWWVILAEKLKDPIPNALLQRYMGLLDQKSQHVLSLYLLQTFIDQDTRHPTLQEATEIAIKEAPTRLSHYQDTFKRWGKQYPEHYGRYGAMTLEDVIEEIKKERLAVYLGSAIKSKGILALTYKTSGSTAVKLLQDYMKQHYQRRSQIEAMLSSFSVVDDPLIIQLLLSLSRRYRTTSVQNLAKAFVEQIAERNQWSSDELADRTIPTAGLDDTGILTLEYGSRALTAYVDDKDKFVLKNEDGKILKALPSPRQDDDEALVKEAKSLFSNSKKELKQVIDLQTQRLYEAMCGEREWTSHDWQNYIFAHPIMKRLIERLVWLEVQQDGEILQSFRPSNDGSLLNLEDDEITLQADSRIKIAHRVLLSDEDSQNWLAHFKDYKIKPLFEQLTHGLPSFTPTDEMIEDHKGWITDTFTLRGVITKLGYQRASIEDGGSFDGYFKPFSQLGISTVIRFSGSYVPEENITAVLYDLSFEKKSVRSWQNSSLALADISPVLLAESYADYIKVAAACRGFDPDWKKKTPW